MVEGMRASENAATKSGTSGSGEEGDIENHTPDQIIDQHNVSIIGTKLGRRQTERVDSLPAQTPQWQERVDSLSRQTPQWPERVDSLLKADPSVAGKG